MLHYTVNQRLHWSRRQYGHSGARRAAVGHWVSLCVKCCRMATISNQLANIVGPPGIWEYKLNPIPTGGAGADYTHHITACPSGFENLTTSLSIKIATKFSTIFQTTLIFFFSLQNSGIQFEKHEQEGIDPIHFAEIMLVSGLVLREPVKWLSFHSGYDFGYLLNLLTNQNLPKTESEFFELLKLYFPNVYDVKYLMKSCKNLKGGLQV